MADGSATQKSTITAAPERSAGAKRTWEFLVAVVALIGFGLAAFYLPDPAEAQNGLVFAYLPSILCAAFGVIVAVSFMISLRNGVPEIEDMVQERVAWQLSRDLSLLDPVTEIYSRHYARVILAREINRLGRNDEGLSILDVDIVNFHHVHDSLGAERSDFVLRDLARLLQEEIRNSDVITHLATNEFLLILCESTERGAAKLPARLKAAMQEWCEVNRMKEFELRVAVGLARYAQGESADSLLLQARHAMVLDRDAVAVT